MKQSGKEESNSDKNKASRTRKEVNRDKKGSKPGRNRKIKKQFGRAGGKFGNSGGKIEFQGRGKELRVVGFSPIYVGRLDLASIGWI